MTYTEPALFVEAATPALEGALTLVLDAVTLVYEGEANDINGVRDALATCLGALLSANTAPAHDVVDAIAMRRKVVVD